MPSPRRHRIGFDIVWVQRKPAEIQLFHLETVLPVWIAIVLAVNINQTGAFVFWVAVINWSYHWNMILPWTVPTFIFYLEFDLWIKSDFVYLGSGWTLHSSTKQNFECSWRQIRCSRQAKYSHCCSVYCKSCTIQASSSKLQLTPRKYLAIGFNQIIEIQI